MCESELLESRLAEGFSRIAGLQFATPTNITWTWERDIMQDTVMHVTQVMSRLPVQSYTAESTFNVTTSTRRLGRLVDDNFCLASKREAMSTISVR